MLARQMAAKNKEHKIIPMTIILLTPLVKLAFVTSRWPFRDTSIASYIPQQAENFGGRESVNLCRH